jgi:cell division protein FtsL
MNDRAQRIRAERIRADRRSIARLLTVVMIGIFVLVGMRSYAAIIQHENNVLERENEYLQAEIDSLESRIVDETKVTRIEQVATEQFGMVYPSAENVVKLGSGESGVQNLAAAIRSEAYN